MNNLQKYLRISIDIGGSDERNQFQLWKNQMINLLFVIYTG